jgi:anti-sigma B factor antagonist
MRARSGATTVHETCTRALQVRPDAARATPSGATSQRNLVWPRASDPLDDVPQGARLTAQAAMRGEAAIPSWKGHMMLASPYLGITTCHIGRRSVLHLQGELDVCTRERLRCAISSAVKHRPELLAVDLSALRFMDCAGLSVLVWAHQRLAGQQCQLLITGAQPIVQRLIRLTGLDTYLHLSTPESAQICEYHRAPDGSMRQSPSQRNRCPTQEPRPPEDARVIGRSGERHHGPTAR